MGQEKKELLTVQMLARRETRRRREVEEQLAQAIYAIHKMVEANDLSDDSLCGEAIDLLREQLKLTHYEK